MCGNCLAVGIVILCLVVKEGQINCVGHHD